MPLPPLDEDEGDPVASRRNQQRRGAQRRLRVLDITDDEGRSAEADRKRGDRLDRVEQGHGLPPDEGGDRERPEVQEREREGEEEKK